MFEVVRHEVHADRDTRWFPIPDPLRDRSIAIPLPEPEQGFSVTIAEASASLLQTDQIVSSQGLKLPGLVEMFEAEVFEKTHDVVVACCVGMEELDERFHSSFCGVEVAFRVCDVAETNLVQLPQ